MDKKMVVVLTSCSMKVRKERTAGGGRKQNFIFGAKTRDSAGEGKHVAKH
jgi:hypothetical protein